MERPTAHEIVLGRDGLLDVYNELIKRLTENPNQPVDPKSLKPVKIEAYKIDQAIHRILNAVSLMNDWLKER